MNPNDVLAQAQAQAYQAMQQYHDFLLGLLAFQVAGFLLACFVVYLFYARLRDIANELMKFRIAYEFARTPEPQPRARQQSRAEPPKTREN
jgi:hypothetical protein